MAGGVLKGFGITLLVLGILLMVAGLASAAYGAYTLSENDDRLIRSSDAQETGETLLIAGGLGFAAGLVLLIVGLVLNAAGNGRRQRELLQAVAARPAASAQAPPAAKAAPASAPSKKGALLGVASLAVVTLAVFALVALGDGTRAVGLGSTEPTYQPLDFDGSVVQAFSLPIAGSATADDAQSQRQFDTPDGARSMQVELSWDAADAGADALRIIVESPAGSGWTELGRAAGGSPVLLDLPLDGASHLRYRVFPDGDAAVVEQPFHVQVHFA